MAEAGHDIKASGDGVLKFLESLPDAVRGRVESLREIQKKCDSVKELFTKEKKELEAKYRALCDPLYAQRRTIVAGEEKEQGADDPGAVPGFWLKVLNSAEFVWDHVTKRDQPILKYLLDIKSDPIEGEGDKTGFKIVFQFAPNPYFSPLTLEKKYYLGEDEGILEKTEGTDINWTDDSHNPAFKVVKKKPKGSPAGTPATTKKVQTHSFFDFFSQPELPDVEEINDIAELLVEDDFELGCYLKDMVIPHAVSWYTGELTCEQDDNEAGLVADADSDDENQEDDEDDEDGS